MPAFYAHNRFGVKVAGKLEGELKEILQKYHKQFEIGLQGPDLFFFYRPYFHNQVSKYGSHLHEISAKPFFEHGRKVVKKVGRDSSEYAYLLGFLCHYILDSECHPYVGEMIETSGVPHMEIEEEFEKLLLRMNRKNPFTYPIADLVPTDERTVEAILPFYPPMDRKKVRKSLRWLKFVKRLFTVHQPWKQWLINMAMKAVGKYDTYKGQMNQLKDNEKCRESSRGLLERFKIAVDVAAEMIYGFDESLREGKPLHPRLDRTFE